MVGMRPGGGSIRNAAVGGGHDTRRARRDRPARRARERGPGRRMLAEALFSRIEVLGAREATIHLTDAAVAHGFAAAIPDRLDVTVGYDRGERARADTVTNPADPRHERPELRPEGRGDRIGGSADSPAAPLRLPAMDARPRTPRAPTDQPTRPPRTRHRRAGGATSLAGRSP